MRSLMIYGTRPEAIKMAPIVLAMREAADFDPVVAVTGQHREMLDSVNDLFGIAPDIDLDIFQHGMDLTDLSATVLQRCRDLFTGERPDVTLVQGDTTTSTFAALASFYAGVPVVHVEAGLRSGNLTDPFPEELNRQLTGRIAAAHLAPTRRSADNLLAEGIEASRIVVTGNTVIDALQIASARMATPHASPRARTLLVTAHRRENWGERMNGIAQAVAQIASSHPQLRVVVPMHRNPVVRASLEPVLGNLANVDLIEPLDYVDFVRVMQEADLVLTDSGGVQEEAPSLGKPVLVLRETTERPEAVDFGTVRLVGTHPHAIVSAVAELLTDRAVYGHMSRATNPYGDGRAAQRTLDAIRHLFGDGKARPSDFAPERGDTSSASTFTRPA